MRQFQQRQKVRARLYSKPVLIVLLVVTIFMIKAVFNIYTKYKESKLEKQIVLDRLNELKNREEGLKKDIIDLQSPEGQEEEIRKKFNVSKPFEKVVVIVEDDKDYKVEEEKGFFGKLLDKVLFWK